MGLSAGDTKLSVIGDRQSLVLFRMVGASTYEVQPGEDVEEAVRRAARDGSRLIIVLKHVVRDEERLRKAASQEGVTLLVLPTKWAKAEPINVEKLLMEALGLG